MGSHPDRSVNDRKLFSPDIGLLFAAFFATLIPHIDALCPLRGETGGVANPTTFLLHFQAEKHKKRASRKSEKPFNFSVVGDRGFEPRTSTV
jgi:hypothetical protein